MTTLSRIFISFLIIHTKLATPQFLRPPFNLLNRQETILEPTSFIPTSTVNSEPPCNSVFPIPNMIMPPTTTIITDCSPTICKNLADTIQLMIACNLLQNTQGGPEIALQLAAPLINDVMSSPAVSCGCSNPTPNDIPSPNFISPNLVSPATVTPNFYPANMIPPNYVSSIPSNIPVVFEPASSSMTSSIPSVFRPNLVGSITQIPPNAASNLISPNLLSSYSISNNMSPDSVPFPPRMISPPDSCSNNVLPPNIISGIPNRVSPNMPIGAPVSNTKGLINTIMSILGNVQG